jgi:tetratricopeptide (TPR) repeat protein
MELSPTPEKALREANLLCTLVPGGGHLLHMGSHIYMWLGGYKESIECNENAVKCDDNYVKVGGVDSEFYKFYRLHNYHFVIWCSMFDGQYNKAMDYARRLKAQLNKEQILFKLGPFPMGGLLFEAFRSMTWHVLIRFGKWEEILNEPIEEELDIFIVDISTGHYAKTIAYAALNRISEAETEREKFLQCLDHEAIQGKLIHNNIIYNKQDGSGIFGVAKSMINGEIEYRKGNYEKAFEFLKDAVYRDDHLAYDEPWGWMQPTRHALGALLNEQGRFVEAEQVYLEDLKLWKDNMWGLYGLKKSLDGQGKNVSKELLDKIELARSRCDTSFQSSCFCARNNL